VLAEYGSKDALDLFAFGIGIVSLTEVPYTLKAE